MIIFSISDKTNDQILIIDIENIFIKKQQKKNTKFGFYSQVIQ